MEGIVNLLNRNYQDTQTEVLKLSSDTKDTFISFYCMREMITSYHKWGLYCFLCVQRISIIK